MDRRRFLLTSLAGRSPPVVAGTQQPGKVYRIGYLSAGSPTSGEDPQSDRPPSWRWALFREENTSVRVAEDRNLSVEYRFARGALELPDLAAELLRLPGDVIFSETGTAAKAAVRATRVIPIVFSTGDALAEGLTSSLARPDRNATGLSVVTIYTTAKKLELLKRGSPPTLADRRHALSRIRTAG